MLKEANQAQAYFKKKFGEGKPVPAGDYAIPTDTRRGPAFMKVVINAAQEMTDFRLFWDEEFKISWYTCNNDGTKRTDQNAQEKK